MAAFSARTQAWAKLDFTATYSARLGRGRTVTVKVAQAGSGISDLLYTARPSVFTRGDAGSAVAVRRSGYYSCTLPVDGSWSCAGPLEDIAMSGEAAFQGMYPPLAAALATQNTIQVTTGEPGNFIPRHREPAYLSRRGKETCIELASPTGSGGEACVDAEGLVVDMRLPTSQSFSGYAEITLRTVTPGIPTAAALTLPAPATPTNT